MSFEDRKITVEFTMNDDEFESGGNRVTVENLRVEAEIDNAGGIGSSTLYMRIYGMKESDMLRCCTFATLLNKVNKVIVRVLAGDDKTGMSQVFVGSILDGMIDYNQTPDVPLVVQAGSAYIPQVDKAPPNTDREFDVTEKIEALAKSAGFEFHNSDVNKTILANFYTYGSTIQQIRDIARTAGIGLDISNGVVAIWGSGERDKVYIDISPETGLIGCPVFQPWGRTVNTIFNPDIVRGRKVNLTSSVTKASGTFFVGACKHIISSKMPGGPWMTISTLSLNQFQVTQ